MFSSKIWLKHIIFSSKIYNIFSVHCLVRSTSEQQGKERVKHALQEIDCWKDCYDESITILFTSKIYYIFLCFLVKYVIFSSKICFYFAVKCITFSSEIYCISW